MISESRTECGNCSRRAFQRSTSACVVFPHSIYPESDHRASLIVFREHDSSQIQYRRELAQVAKDVFDVYQRCTTVDMRFQILVEPSGSRTRFNCHGILWCSTRTYRHVQDCGVSDAQKALVEMLYLQVLYCTILHTLANVCFRPRPIFPVSNSFISIRIGHNGYGHRAVILRVTC